MRIKINLGFYMHVVNFINSEVLFYRIIIVPLKIDLKFYTHVVNSIIFSQNSFPKDFFFRGENICWPTDAEIKEIGKERWIGITTHSCPMVML